MLRTANDSAPDTVSVTRVHTKLWRNLNTWQKTQLQQYHLLCDYNQLVDSAMPENAQLQLPSAFTAALCQTLGLTELATIEYEL